MNERVLQRLTLGGMTLLWMNFLLVWLTCCLSVARLLTTGSPLDGLTVVLVTVVLVALGWFILGFRQSRHCASHLAFSRSAGGGSGAFRSGGPVISSLRIAPIECKTAYYT